MPDSKPVRYQYVNQVLASMIRERTGANGAKFYTAAVTIPEHSIQSVPDAKYVSVRLQSMDQIHGRNGQEITRIGLGATGNVSLRFYADRPIPAVIRVNDAWKKIDNLYGHVSDKRRLPADAIDLNKLHQDDIKARGKANQVKILEAMDKAGAVADQPQDQQCSEDFGK